jgi:hypothetical protein
MLQSEVLDINGHSRPPNFDGKIMFLVCTRVPPLQDSVHSVYAPQCETVQSWAQSTALHS